MSVLPGNWAQLVILNGRWKEANERQRVVRASVDCVNSIFLFGFGRQRPSDQCEVLAELYSEPRPRKTDNRGAVPTSKSPIVGISSGGEIKLSSHARSSVRDNGFWEALCRIAESSTGLGGRSEKPDSATAHQCKATRSSFQSARPDSASQKSQGTSNPRATRVQESIVFFTILSFRAVYPTYPLPPSRHASSFPLVQWLRLRVAPRAVGVYPTIYQHKIH